MGDDDVASLEVLDVVTDGEHLTRGAIPDVHAALSPALDNVHGVREARVVNVVLRGHGEDLQVHVVLAQRPEFEVAEAYDASDVHLAERPVLALGEVHLGRLDGLRRDDVRLHGARHLPHTPVLVVHEQERAGEGRPRPELRRREVPGR